MRSLALGIDLGTSAVKSVLTLDGNIMGVGSAALSISSPRSGWSEQDPAEWICAVVQAVQQALENAGASGAEIAGISLSGQMHGAVLLDKNNTVLRPVILWNDNRSTVECMALADKCPEIGHIAGVPPLPGFTAPKLMWVKQNEPDIFRQIDVVLLPKDYIALWLSGRRSSDFSDAAGTLWLDQRKRVWSEELARASDIDPTWLPPLHHGIDPIGDVCSEAANVLSISQDTQVFAGAGDAAAGALSIGAAAAGRCFISLGTSGQLLVVDDGYRPNPDKFVHAYCHTLPNLWYRMAAMLNGARPLSWFAGILNCTVPELLAQASQANLDRVPLFLPYLTGERSPHGDPNIRSGFFGLDDATGRPEMCRAVVEAIAFTMRDAMDSFGDSFSPTGAIPVIGGGARSDLVLHTLSSVLERPITKAEGASEGPAYGAALLAETGLGMRDTASLAFDVDISARFEAIANSATMERLDRFRTLYGVLKRRA